tara:strand:+ start:595 stop:3273 length:2679 start_codon:yes stop_codon:yes gene_type:complete
MKSFKSYLKEYGGYGVDAPAFAVGGASTGPGMGQYVPSADLNLRASKQAVSGGKVAKFITGNNVTFQGKKYKKVELEVLKVDNKSQTVEVAFISPKELENRKVNMSFRYLRRGPFVATKIPNYFEEKNPRIPRKKGQPAGSKKHSDLYTDENPKGTIHGLGFKDVATARASVKKIENSGKKHAHKIQAAIAMEQRARVMGKTAEAAVYRAYIEKMKKKTKQMQKEDFEPVNQGKLSELIFRGSRHGDKNDLYNMLIPVSSTLFKRIFPKQVRGTFFHVTDTDGFENLYDIQNSKKSIAAFANMTAKDIKGGVASGSGIIAEVEGNALAASAQDLMSLPTRDGRRLIFYKFFHDEFNKEQVKGMDKSMSVLLQAMIRKYALPSRVKKPRYSPYFSDFEVFKSIRNDYENKKYDERNKDAKTAGKRMQMLIKDYLNGIERILKKHAKGVQEVLTGYLKRKSTNRNWDEVVIDDVNITRVFIVSDHFETKIFKKDQLDHEDYKKNLEFAGVPVEIKKADEVVQYVAKVRDKSLKENYITEDGHTASARIDARQKRERERLKIKHDREDGRAARQDAAAKDTARRVAERFKQSDVDGLEKFADRLLKKFKIDVEFTRHFVDRLNDPRNSPEIKIAELQRLFKKIKKNKGIGISSNPDIEAVLKDMETNLNLPVVIKKKGNEFELINKTIMRKPDFKTTSKVIRYENAPNTKDAMKRYRAGKAGFTDIAHLKAKGLIKRSDGTKRKSAKYEDTKCPPGYKFDKKLNACVPKGKVVYYAPFFGRMKDPTPSNGQDANNTGNGQNGNGTNGNGGNGNGGNGQTGNGQTGNGQSGGESYLVADVRKMPGGGYGVYADVFKKGRRVMTPGGKHRKELKKVYKNKKDANDYMAAIMIAKGGG